MLSNGVDIVEIRRITRHVHRFGERFLKYVYCPAEIGRYASDSERLAGAFAAKEAVAKALGVGFAYLTSFGVLPSDIEISLSKSLAVSICRVALHGTARQRSIDLHLAQWTLGVVRLDGYAIALVTATSADVPPQSTIIATLSAGRSIVQHRLSYKTYARSITLMKKSEFLLLMDELIEADPGTLKGSEALPEVEGWDSVAVMGFIALVDEQFELMLSPRRLAECCTINDLVGMVGNHIEG